MFVLGYYSEKDHTKIALLNITRKGVRIEHVGNENDVKPFYIKNPTIVTGLGASEVFIREIQLKLTSKRAIDKALPFQLEAAIPFPLEEAIVHPVIRKIDKKNTGITFFTTKNSYIEKHLETLKNLEINPDQVTNVPSALVRFAQYVAPKTPSLTLIHIGEEKSLYLCIVEGKLIFAQTLNFGKNQILENDQFIKDLQRINEYANKKTNSSESLITGEFPDNIEQVINNHLGMESVPIELSHLKPYAIPIGLALEHQNGIQFLMGPYKPASAIKKKNKQLFIYLAACLGLSLCVFLGSLSLSNYRKKTLLTQIKKYSSLSDDQDISSALAAWEKKMVHQKQTAQVSAPKVSDLLAWLSAHPKLEGIEIKRARYQMLKYPKIGKEKEPYEVKVELEFTASSPRVAREFHEVLITGDALINPKASITWNASQDHYATTFYLNGGR